MRVVAVAVDHQVDVHVPEAGQHAHAFGGDHLGAGGHRERADLPTAVMRSPSMRTTLLRSGRPPKPSISVPPTSALMRAWRRPLLAFRCGCDGERDGDGDEQGGGGVAHAREYTRLRAPRYGEAGSNVLRFVSLLPPILFYRQGTLAAIPLDMRSRRWRSILRRNRTRCDVGDMANLNVAGGGSGTRTLTVRPSTNIK